MSFFDKIQGMDSVNEAILESIKKTKASIIIITPIIIPEILSCLSEVADQNKKAKFLMAAHIDLGKYGDTIQTLLSLGNIQIHQLTSSGDVFAYTKDGEEVLVASYSDEDEMIVGYKTNNPTFNRIYAQMIGPYYMTSSRPLKKLKKRF